MNNDWTIKKLFEEILRIEVEYKLFDKKVNGVYFWKLIRFHLFMELTKKLNLYEEAHPGLKQSENRSDNRYVRVLKRLINGTVNGPIYGIGDIEIMLFPHERKVNIDSKMIDIYSYHLEDRWRKDEADHLVIEKPFNGKFIRKASKTVRYDQPLTFFSSRKFFKPKEDIYVDFSMNEPDSIANIPTKKIEILSTENISRVVNNFKREYDYYTKILVKHSPKKLYVVVAYFKHSLVAAANDLGIETIEIQHGTITSFHIGYSYPANIKIPYFPKKLRLWGKFWYDISQLPIDEKNISYDGFPFLHQEIEKYSDIVRDELRILFISQGTIGKSLVDMALEFASQNKEFKVVYRLHPSEAGKWKVLYPKLYSFSMENRNIVVEAAIENPLYRSFAESKFVVGVYSTALIESLAASCRLILVDLPGVEYFQDLIDRELVKKVKNIDELLSVIEEQDEVIINSDYFFEIIKKSDP